MWDVSKSTYGALERINIWKNNVHDPELLLLMDSIYNNLSKNINILEKQLVNFNIKAPKKNRVKMNISTNSDLILDEYIAHDVFLFCQEYIELLLRAFGRSTLNDTVRKIFKNKGMDRYPPFFSNYTRRCTRKIGFLGSL